MPLSCWDNLQHSNPFMDSFIPEVLRRRGIWASTPSTEKQGATEVTCAEQWDWQEQETSRHEMYQWYLGRSWVQGLKLVMTLHQGLTRECPKGWWLQAGSSILYSMIITSTSSSTSRVQTVLEHKLKVSKGFQIFTFALM